MAHIVRRQGRRVYIRTTFGEPAVQLLKDLKAHWDPDERVWWLGEGKLEKLKDVLVEADREQDRRFDAGEPPTAPEKPEDIRLVGKCKYKGRVYFARYMGETKRGRAARLVTLDLEKDFWAPLPPVGEKAGPDQAEVLKTYAPREVWDGRRYSNRTVRKYVTVASMREWVARQKDPETARGECTECGEWGPRGESCGHCHEGTFA